MILTGHVLTMLRTLPAESVQCVVTSPPYWGLRSYGSAAQIWGGDPGHRHAFSSATFRRGPAGKQGSTSARIGRSNVKAQEQAQQSQGSFCECGAWRGDLGLEPTPELYAQHIVEIFREVRRVLRNDGTLWLNLGDCYATGGGKVGDCPGGGAQGARYRGDHGPDPKSVAIGPQTQPNRMPINGLKPKDLVGIPWRIAFALQGDGWWLRSDIIWHKPNPMPESVTDRPTKSHEYLFLLTKNARYSYDSDAVKEPGVYPAGVVVTGSLARFGRGEKFIAANAHRGKTTPITTGTRNRRSVWTVCTKPYKGAHFATFPPALVEPCILAGSRLGDTILDPFAGVCTVGLVAQQHGREFIGIELSAKYCKMAAKRLEEMAVRRAATA